VKKFFKKHVSNGEDLKIFVISIGLILAGIAAIVHTTVVLVNHTAAPDQPLRYFTGAGLAALGFIFLACLRIGNGPAFKADVEKMRRHSYLHPDNWPRGRIDPPDGLSD